jgi:hypothetical protein
MSDPTSFSKTPEEPTERADRPIDPTRTFDAYFDKQAPTTPAEPVVHQDDDPYTPPAAETLTPPASSTPPGASASATGTTETTGTTGTTGTTTGFAPDDDRIGATEPRAVRLRTVVFGLVLLVIAGAVLVGQLTDITVDAGAVLLALMIGGGLLLIAGARRT